MASHRLFISPASGSAFPDRPGEIDISGDEARHAVRVKRLEPGERIELLDGYGRIASGRVVGALKQSGEWVLRAAIDSIRVVEPARPQVEVCAAVPKGAALGEMIDALSQVGAAAWRPLLTERTGDPLKPAGLATASARHDRLTDRLERIAAEACKQSGRAWRLRVGGAIGLTDAVAPHSCAAADARAAGDADRTPPTRVVLAAVAGTPYERSGAPVVRVLIGPEGGWTPGELAAARDAGAAITRFGPHVMRIETAAAVAAAIVLDREARG